MYLYKIMVQYNFQVNSSWYLCFFILFLNQFTIIFPFKQIHTFKYSQFQSQSYTKRYFNKFSNDKYIKQNQLYLSKLDDFMLSFDSNNLPIWIENWSQSLQFKLQILQQQTDPLKQFLENLINHPDNLNSLYDFLVHDSIAQSTVGVSATLILFAMLNSNEQMIEGQPYGSLNKYDPYLAEEYFRSRPIQVLFRSAEIGFRSSSFGFRLALDYFFNKLTDPVEESKRANELCELLTVLGPTFIKVGQSLSIRTDLIRPAYITALTKLQDRVPSFPTAIAKEIIKSELSKDADSIFLQGFEDDDSVIAAASLGQVYKCILRKDGSEVAVKVQRPSIVNSIALDMYILRQIVPNLKVIFDLNSDVVGIVDDWGIGFVNEIDYLSEAKNAQVFMEMIQKTPLNDVVFAPEVIPALSSKKVLTTRWVDGERLEKSNAKDISTLCSIAMNTYLTMLLASPILHCDPHPGNLRRTPDGKLCIMDWGLVTSVDSSIQSTLIIHVSHLVSKDYEKIPADLVKLGFVPSSKEQFIANTDVVALLADIYGKWAKGGGTKRIDINAVVNQINELADEYGNLFRLPPYFAYIAKAFSVLEGIGLSSDPDYSILNECLPYISKRLISDASPATEDALESFIFGKEKDNQDRVIDSERLELIVQGYDKYAQATKGFQQHKAEKSNILYKVDEISDQIFDLLFPEGSITSISPMQRVVIQEIAKYIGSFLRLQLQSLKSQSQGLVLPFLNRNIVDFVIDPLGLFVGSKLIEADTVDERIVESTNKLVGILVKYFPSWQFNPSSGNLNDMLTNMSTIEIQQVIQKLIRKIFDKRVQLQFVLTFLISEILQQAARRIDQSKPEDRILNSISDIESTNDQSWNYDTTDVIEEKIKIDSPRAKKARDLLQSVVDEVR